MKKTEFDNKEFFTVRELAELFDRSPLRIYQVIDSGEIPYWTRPGGEIRKDILVAKDSIPAMMEVFKTDRLAGLAGPGRPRNPENEAPRRGRPRGSKNQPGHRAGRPRKDGVVVQAKKGPGRPKGSKNKPGHKAGRPRKVQTPVNVPEQVATEVALAPVAETSVTA